MKSHLLALLAATVLLGFLQSARADTEITFQDFYDSLSPDGDWVELEEYGYCWRPFVDDQWRPYTDGQWVYTDAGYTWLSNEPWGWATYHYGRWTKVKNWGWVWVPGYEWGPAWVSWRTNDDYIGWAALPPEAVWEPSTGFSVFVDIDYGIGPDWYAFCPVTYFCAPRLRTVCLPWRNNITIINNTVNITKIRNVNNGIIFNDGPDINIINRRADSPLRRLRLERERNIDVAALREGRIKSRLEGDTLKIPAPRVENKQGRPTKIAGRAGSTQINRGWDSAVKNPELAKVYRDRIREEAERSGRRPHKEFTEKPPQEQPPRSSAGVIGDRPTDPSQPNTTEGSNPPTSTPRQQDRRREIQNQPPGEGDPQRQQREEELRNRILEQRQQQNEQRRQRQQENDQGTQDPQQRQQEIQQQLQERRERQQQQQQANQQQAAQQEAAENTRRQQAEQARDKALRAQQEFEARREAARQQRQQEQQQQQQQQQETSRRQDQQRQQQAQEQQRQQQQQQQSQIQQLQQQMQQQRQERQQQRQERQQQRQGN
jgi:DNA segregation ATPase FtsK/SpoIIIE-like protein